MRDSLARNPVRSTHRSGIGTLHEKYVICRAKKEARATWRGNAVIHLRFEIGDGTRRQDLFVSKLLMVYAARKLWFFGQSAAAALKENTPAT